MADAPTWGSTFRDAPADALIVYDEFIRPLFEPFTLDLVERAAPARGEHIVDVACGPGTVTRYLASRVGPEGRVTGTDISGAMLELAQRQPADPGAAPITWVESPGAPLALPDAIADQLTCQQGLQFMPDKVAALAEARRVLKPGAVARFSFWAPVDRCRCFTALHEAIGEVLSPELAERYAAGPWSLDGAVAADAAQAAGFAKVQVEQVTYDGPLPADPPSELVRSLSATGIAAEVAALDDVTRARLRDATAAALERILGSTQPRTASLTTWLLTCSG